MRESANAGECPHITGGDMTTLNAAIIGAGAIHRSHVNALRLLPGVALRAMVDIDKANG